MADVRAEVNYNRPVIPLSDAYLCVDCDGVGNDSRVCWHCSSKSVISLATALSAPRAEA